MAITGHRTASVFAPCNITDARDLQATGAQLAAHVGTGRLEVHRHR
jgi:hypothetical protein